MKIIGFTKIDGETKMVLKSDSSLLVNRKPFFIPDWSKDIRMTPCWVLRVSRLGKHISTRFASRYYDKVAPALNICAADYLEKGDMVRAWAFDYSLPMGVFADAGNVVDRDTIISFDEAISIASQVMTIRQGDLVFVECSIPARTLEKEEVITATIGDQELLYCKVK
jgi:2-keto-4-pentenoate hydratase/2-oxohepta-3-ene-1,7-dioic acid hydratase in catechol pathway